MPRPNLPAWQRHWSKRDKLDRYHGLRPVLANLHLNIWCTLSGRERTSLYPNEAGAFFRRRAADRRALRDYVRSLVR